MWHSFVHNELFKWLKWKYLRIVGKQGKFVSLGQYTDVYPEHVQYLLNNEETIFSAPLQTNFEYHDIVINSGLSRNWVVLLMEASCFAQSEIIQLHDGNYFCETKDNKIFGRSSDCSDGQIFVQDKWYVQYIHIPTKTENVSKGIFLSGLFSFNYYHFTYQIIPKLNYLDLIPNEVPLLVDESTLNTPSFNSLLHLCNKHDRAIYVMKKNVRYFVGSLYLISSQTILLPNYKPHFRHPGIIVFYKYSSLLFLNELKYKILRGKSVLNHPKRIFLSRKKAAPNRRSFNEEDCVKVARQYGFEPIYPEELSFIEQVAVFNNADCILGSSGGALTNIVYCKKDVKVIVLAKYKIFCEIWQPIIEFIGGKLVGIYEVNPNMSKINIEELHANFFIDTTRLERILKHL